MNFKKKYLRYEKFKNYILFFLDFIFFNLAILLSNLIRLNNFEILSKSYLIFYIFSVILFFIFVKKFSFYSLSFRYYNLDTQKKIFNFIFLYSLILLVFVNLFTLDNFPRSLSLIFPICLFFFIIFYRMVLLYLISEKEKIYDNKKKAIFIGLSSFVKNYSFLKSSDEYYIDKVLTSNNKTDYYIGDVFVQSFLKFEEIIINQNYQVLITTNEQKSKFPKLLEFYCKKYQLEILIFDEKNYFKDYQDRGRDKEKIDNSEYLLRPELNFDKIKWIEFFQDKTILISGGAGTIGSGVANFLSNSKVKKIIIADHSEYRLWKVKEDLRGKKNFHKYEFKLIDFTNKSLIEKSLNNIKINCVIHASAYKHVNIVEKNIWASLYNNLFTTKNLIDYVKEKKIKNFLLISSDKAVDPENIMGLSKRVCELQVLVEAEKNLYEKNKTIFNIVRFGNVFRSSGSLVEVIDEKIKKKETLEITDLSAKRYFMSIEEASFLILDIIVNESKIENLKIHVLDMGEEIVLNDFIINYINKRYSQRIKNLKDNDFIKIKIIGLQKGEKLNEKLSTSKLLKSNFNKKILYENQNITPDKIKNKILILIDILSNTNLTDENLIEELKNFKY